MHDFCALSIQGSNILFVYLFLYIGLIMRFCESFFGHQAFLDSLSANLAVSLVENCLLNNHNFSAIPFVRMFAENTIWFDYALH